MQDIPGERDLPAGRLAQMKDELMAQIEHIEDHPETAPRTATAVRHHRWRRIALAAAALAAGLGIATSLVVGGHESASANTAERTEEGGILITIREARHPKDLQRRLNDLGVPAVVDFVEGGGGLCELDRTTGWVTLEGEPGESRVEALLTTLTSPHDDPTYILHPDQVRPGETVVLEFKVEQGQGSVVAAVKPGLTTAPVGPCEPVGGGRVVDG